MTRNTILLGSFDYSYNGRRGRLGFKAGSRGDYVLVTVNGTLPLPTEVGRKFLREYTAWRQQVGA